MDIFQFSNVMFNQLSVQFLIYLKNKRHLVLKNDESYTDTVDSQL